MIGALTSSSYGKGSGPVHITTVQCTGSETDILNCPYYTQTCSSAYDAAVICEGIYQI